MIRAEAETLGELRSIIGDTERGAVGGHINYEVAFNVQPLRDKLSAIREHVVMIDVDDKAQGRRVVVPRDWFEKLCKLVGGK